MKLSKRPHVPLIPLVFLILAFLSPALAETDLFSGLNDSSDKKLDITADTLVSDQNSHYIMFSGNVEAVYGKTKMKADSLKVLYTDKPVDQQQVSDRKIDKIVATGHVKIEMDDKTGYCDQAEYLTDTKIMTLTGESVRIQSGDNYITGEKITIRQETGQIIVDGNPEKRVNAVFKSESNSLNMLNEKAGTLKK